MTGQMVLEVHAEVLLEYQYLWRIFWTVFVPCLIVYITYMNFTSIYKRIKLTGQ